MVLVAATLVWAPTASLAASVTSQVIVRLARVPRRVGSSLVLEYFTERKASR